MKKFFCDVRTGSEDMGLMTYSIIDCLRDFRKIT